VGVDFQNPHLGEKHPNSPLDLMGDPIEGLMVEQEIRRNLDGCGRVTR
jgi:hypothetical protein